jgi:hypothetical protein
MGEVVVHVSSWARWCSDMSIEIFSVGDREEVWSFARFNHFDLWWKSMMCILSQKDMINWIPFTTCPTP